MADEPKKPDLSKRIGESMEQQAARIAGTLPDGPITGTKSHSELEPKKKESLADLQDKLFAGAIAARQHDYPAGQEVNIDPPPKSEKGKLEVTANGTFIDGKPVSGPVPTQTAPIQPPPSLNAADASASPQHNPFWKKISLDELVVFVICESIAAPINIAAGDAFVKHTGEEWFGWGIGLPIALAGFTFHWWKRLIPLPQQQWIHKKARWWPLPVLAAIIWAYAYVVVPDMYRKAQPIVSAPVAKESNVNLTIEQIIGQHFENEKVVLDGKWFINCTFENVTFEYDGGPGKMDNPTVKGTFALKTANGTVSGTICLLKLLQSLSPEMAEKWQGCPVPPP